MQIALEEQRLRCAAITRGGGEVPAAAETDERRRPLPDFSAVTRTVDRLDERLRECARGGASRMEAEFDTVHARGSGARVGGSIGGVGVARKRYEHGLQSWLAGGNGTG